MMEEFSRISRRRRRCSSSSFDSRSPSTNRDQTHVGQPTGVLRGENPRSLNHNENSVDGPLQRSIDPDHENRDRESPDFEGFAQGAESEIHLPPKMREIIGDNPSTSKSTAPVLHSSLTDRWSIWLKEGVPYTEYTEVRDRYPTPSNMQGISPPLLNPEIAESLNAFNKKRDDSLVTFQRQVATALSASGTALTTLMNRATDDESLFGPLWDVGKSLVALHCDLSRYRKKSICDALPGPLRSVAGKALPSKFLFGDELRSLIKDQQGIASFAKDLAPRPSTSQIHQPSTSNNRLNLKRPAPAKRGGGAYPAAKPRKQAPRYKGYQGNRSSRNNFFNKPQNRHQ
ncbi:hypothetical protein GE061_018630 [Apolygus lucorum]|uniref:Uncharacterized protein n=1 Tax=Apolygus lucorum TaxID=248454 RepID=A0A8S9XFR0_APOLU|nr:hypothetical protein GE061_018630 [Apolygus lucorum]